MRSPATCGSVGRVRRGLETASRIGSAMLTEYHQCVSRRHEPRLKTFEISYYSNQWRRVIRAWGCLTLGLPRWGKF